MLALGLNQTRTANGQIVGRIRRCVSYPDKSPAGGLIAACERVQKEYNSQMPDPNPTPTVAYPKNCGHQKCHCLAPSHSSYCSDECQHAAQLDDMGPCPCKHPECLTQ
jgi:hypothetical protein